MPVEPWSKSRVDTRWMVFAETHKMHARMIGGIGERLDERKMSLPKGQVAAFLPRRGVGLLQQLLPQDLEVGSHIPLVLEGKMRVALLTTTVSVSTWERAVALVVKNWSENVGIGKGRDLSLTCSGKGIEQQLMSKYSCSR